MGSANASALARNLVLAGATEPTVDGKQPYEVTTCSFHLREGPRGSSSCTPALMTAAPHPAQHELAASWTATLRTGAMIATVGCRGRGRGATAGVRGTPSVEPLEIVACVGMPSWFYWAD